jgi:hypothetical protein
MHCAWQVCGPDAGARRRLRAVKDRIADTFTGMGVDPAFGVKLQTVFRRAGLSAPRLTLGAPLAGADAIEILTCVVETCRSVFPMAEQLGLVTDELADLDTLLPRSRPETGTIHSVCRPVGGADRGHPSRRRDRAPQPGSG